MALIQKKIMIWLLIAVATISLPFSTGCSSRYSYSSYRSKAETALGKKKFKQARELYSVIYQQETAEGNNSADKAAWAFYRLGVIAEVTGDIRMAKGYYWGDKIDEGFYQPFPETDWFAQTGWNVLDQGNSPRSIESILAFEASGLPQASKASVPDRKKREIIVPGEIKRQPVSTPDKNKPQRTFYRSLTPPQPGVPGPFKVFY